MFVDMEVVTRVTASATGSSGEIFLKHWTAGQLGLIAGLLIQWPECLLKDQDEAADIGLHSLALCP